MKGLVYVTSEFNDGVCAVGLHGYIYHPGKIISKGIGKGCLYPGPKGYYDANKKDDFSQSVEVVSMIDYSVAIPAAPTYKRWLLTKVKDQKEKEKLLFLENIVGVIESLPSTYDMGNNIKEAIDHYHVIITDETGIVKEAIKYRSEYFATTGDFNTSFIAEYKEKSLGTKESIRAMQTAAILGNNNFRLGITKVKLSKLVLSKPEGYFNIKPIDRHPLERQPYLYSESLESSKTEEGKYVYFLGRHERKGDNSRDLAGKKDSAYYFSVMIVDEPNDNFEHFFSVQKMFIKNEPTNNLVAINLATCFNSRTYQALLDTPLEVVTPGKSNDGAINLQTGDGSALTNEFKTAKLSYNLKHDFKYIYDVLRMHQGFEPNVTLAVRGDRIIIEDLKTEDITAVFYDALPGDKGLKLKPSITSATRVIKVKITLPNGETKTLKLEPSVYLPDRNALAKLAQLNPKVLLVSWMECENLCRYAVIIETVGVVSIYAPIYRNYHLLF